MRIGDYVKFKKESREGGLDGETCWGVIVRKAGHADNPEAAWQILATTGDMYIQFAEKIQSLEKNVFDIMYSIC